MADVIPRVIRMHASDNVAIVANDGGLPAQISIIGFDQSDPITLIQKIPQGHKVSLKNIATGDAIK